MNQPTPLNANQMTSALQQVFTLLGDLKIEGNQAQLLLNLRSAVAEVNNSLVHFIQESSKKEQQVKECCKVNGEAKCMNEEAPAAA